MKGFLTKDWYLLLQRRQTLIIFLAVCLIMGVSMDGGFAAAYMVFLGMLLAVSTIAYDEADNGLPFLLTLPAGRRTYALSKYVLAAGLCGIFWLAACGLILIAGAVRGTGTPAADLAAAAACLPAVLLAADLMIPLQLKYGAEKSRIALLVVCGSIAALVMLGRRLFPDLPAALAAITIPMPALMIGSVLLCSVLTAASIFFSCRIMGNKVF